MRRPPNVSYIQKYHNHNFVYEVNVLDEWSFPCKNITDVLALFLNTFWISSKVNPLVSGKNRNIAAAPEAAIKAHIQKNPAAPIQSTADKNPYKNSIHD